MGTMILEQGGCCGSCVLNKRCTTVSGSFDTYVPMDNEALNGHDDSGTRELICDIMSLRLYDDKTLVLYKRHNEWVQRRISIPLFGVFFFLQPVSLSGHVYPIDMPTQSTHKVIMHTRASGRAMTHLGTGAKGLYAHHPYLGPGQ
jgi:hypothetical protein